MRAKTVAAAGLLLLTAVPAMATETAKKPLRATVSPSPGAQYAESAAQLSFRGVTAKELKGLVVTGSRSGKHTGRIEAWSDGSGASFLPAKKFRSGEKVTVTAPFAITGGNVKGDADAYTFTVGSQTAINLGSLPGVTTAPATQSFYSEPDLHPAAPTTTVATGSSPGDIFTTPEGLPGLQGNEIDDPEGNLVYYVHTDKLTAGFRVQKYRGKPVLTWWQGDLVAPGFGRGVDEIADDTYKTIATVKAGNGLDADAHEFTLTARNTALVTAYVGEKSNGRSVIDGVVQEIDVKTGLVEFEWHALDHIPLSDSVFPTPAKNVPYDAYHVNSIQTDGSADLLVSLRDTSELLVVDRSTGAVDLRIGGRRSQVKEPAGASSSLQHDAEPHGSNEISVLDNAVGVGTSRGLVYKLNGKKLSVVATLAAPNGEQAYSGGSIQPLASGYLVDFGSAGSVVEYDTGGAVIRDVHYQLGESTYRADKAIWHAKPTTRPAMAGQKTAKGSTLWASWNGATEVASWRIMGGADYNHITALTTVPRTGFETQIASPLNLGVEYAQALDAAGHVLGTTGTLALT